MGRRCRLVGTETEGTVLEFRMDGWMTIQWDGVWTPCDLWAPLDRGVVEMLS